MPKTLVAPLLVSLPALLGRGVKTVSAGKDVALDRRIETFSRAEILTLSPDPNPSPSPVSEEGSLEPP